MGAIASQITSLTSVYSFVYSDADQRKYQSSMSLAFVWGIDRGPVNSPHKWPVTRKMFPFDDVIMYSMYVGTLEPVNNIIVVNWHVRQVHSRKCAQSSRFAVFSNVLLVGGLLTSYNVTLLALGQLYRIAMIMPCEFTTVEWSHLKILYKCNAFPLNVWYH